MSPSGAPLSGITILLVEDSASASEALRLMAVRSGARLRRADSLASAARHLAIYRPSVVIVDLGLPDGDGMTLIQSISEKAVPCPALIATSGSAEADWADAAWAAGANALLPKPIEGINQFQEIVLRAMPG